MELKDLLSLYFERSNSMQTFWSLYITIVLGLLVFFGSGRRSKYLGIILSIAFAMFAYVNLDGLIDVTKQRNALNDLVYPMTVGNSSCSLAASRIYPTLDPPKPCAVRLVHITGDLLTLACMWFFVLKPYKAPQNRGT